MANLKKELGSPGQILLLLIFTVFLVYNSCCHPRIIENQQIGPCLNQSSVRVNCGRIDSITLLVPGLPNNEYKLPIKCNQVIFNPTSNKSFNDLVRNYLNSQCFEQIYVCPCEPAFELWENFTTEGNDVGVAIARAPKLEATDCHLFPNIVSKIPDLNDGVINGNYKHVDSFIECKFLQKEVFIAIVDTGIDSTIRNQDRDGIPNDQWQPFHLTGNHCDISPNTFRANNPLGLRFVENEFNNSSADLNGHGTGVNFVAAGLSEPNIQTDIRFKFLNIKSTTGTSKIGNLFDALCGINYACKQSPKIVNISWGFKYFRNSSHPRIDLGLMQAFKDIFYQNKDILFVTAAGNDGMELTKRQKFYPASASTFCSNVLAVGAVVEKNGNFEISTFSNYQTGSTKNFVYTYGQNIKIVKFGILNPESNNLSTENIGRNYIYNSGTSFAAPLISRIAGIISIKERNLNGPGLRSFIAQEARLNTGIIPGKKLKIIDMKCIQNICNIEE
ncbi:MAG: S8 family serine peptidase [Saprospiraceae bacterium]|nr:S8 family serine peptidase [Saprospiraceae bacterium]